MKIFNLPDLGEGLAEAEIREWYVKPGDTVQVDQPLVSMETAKAIVDVPSPYAGKISILHGNVNDVIQTGAPLITFDAETATKDAGSVVGKLETSDKKWQDDVVTANTSNASVSIKAVPAARVLAKELQVDLQKVPPTGPQGLITVEDVKKFIAHAPHSDTQKETLHGVRRFMAQAMTHSHHEIVPVTIFEDAVITHWDKNADLSVRVLQAMIAAAKAEPALNAWFDGKTFARKLFDDVHIGLAVDSAEGLFVPVIKEAQRYSAEELRTQLNHYKQAVQTRQLHATDMQGATITLSNYGMIAGKYATPIIVPPAVAILACGRSREIPLVQDNKVVVGRIIPLSLTFDHRAVTGGEATRYLGEIVKHLEQ